MIKTDEFFQLLESKISFFTGVPDSLLKDFCAYLSDNVDNEHHIIAANEGSSIGLAAGHYLATGKPGLVYMQNSGLGNTVNPLLSLMDRDVYGIPVLMIIGWRGEPGTKDEPQHVKQGKTTLALLECMDIDYSVMDEESDAEEILSKAFASMEECKPYAIVVRKNTFSPYKLLRKVDDISNFERESAIRAIVEKSGLETFFVSTTGKISRELFEIREQRGESHDKDFLTVGSMGHTSQIAVGIALARKGKKIICLDGDGSVLMHMGGLAVNGSLPLGNMVHIMLNNCAHDTVGGQPTVSAGVDFCTIARSCGYKTVRSCDEISELKSILDEINDIDDLTFIEIKIKKGARKDLGRPTRTPEECKISFSAKLREEI